MARGAKVWRPLHRLRFFGANLADVVPNRDQGWESSEFAGVHIQFSNYE
jgi:hypothetical protein